MRTRSVGALTSSRANASEECLWCYKPNCTDNKRSVIRTRKSKTALSVAVKHKPDAFARHPLLPLHRLRIRSSTTCRKPTQLLIGIPHLHRYRAPLRYNHMAYQADHLLCLCRLQRQHPRPTLPVHAIRAIRHTQRQAQRRLRCTRFEHPRQHLTMKHRWNGRPNERPGRGLS